MRPAGLTFLAPSWLFVGCMLTLMGFGIIKVMGRAPAAVAPAHAPATLQVASLWLLVHAFANGCSAITGIEAVSNAVPIFKPPSVDNTHPRAGIG